MVPPTETSHEVYVSTTKTIIFNFYNDLEENINDLYSLKIKIYPGKNVPDLCASIQVGDDCLESFGSFKPENLRDINRILQDNFDYRFNLWVIHKYKDVTEFLNKLYLCEDYIIQPEYLNNYNSHVKQVMREYK